MLVAVANGRDLRSAARSTTSSSRSLTGDPGTARVLRDVDVTSHMPEAFYCSAHGGDPKPGSPRYAAWLEAEWDAGRVDAEQATELLYEHEQIVRRRETTSRATDGEKEQR